MKKIVIAALAAFFVSAGCATLTEGNADAKLVTMYAVIKITDGDHAKAARIKSIATHVREYATGEQYLTVDLLIEAIRDQVPWGDLDAADELLIHMLIDRLRAELVARLGAEVLPEDLRLAVDTVAGWVIDAARMT